MGLSDTHPDFILLPRAVRLPVELVPPPGFRPDQLARVPPVLAVEVAGRDDHRQYLAAKAQWYLNAGVEIVWRVHPEKRDVTVVTAQEIQRFRSGDTLPPHRTLPDLTPSVRDFFVQIETAGPPG